MAAYKRIPSARHPLGDPGTHQISLSPLIVGDIAAMAVECLARLLHLSLVAAEASRRPARVLGLCRSVERGDQDRGVDA